MSKTGNAQAEQSALKRALAIVAASLGLGLAFDLLFFEKLPGVSFPLYIELVLLSLLVALRLQKKELPRSAYWIIPPLVFLSFMVFVRASGFVVFLDVVASVYLLGLLIMQLAKPDLSRYQLGDYLRPALELPRVMLQKFGETLNVLVARRSFITKHQSLPQVLRGVLIALPVLLLFVILFSSADLVFRQYVTDIFDWNISDELFARTMLVLLVTVGFIGAFGALNAKARVSVAKPAKSPGGMIEATILFASLNALFLSFIVIQLAYLFGGAANVTGGDFTFAEYARKGFFELIAVAALSLLLIWGADKLLLRGVEQHSLRFKLLAGALIVQVMVVMASAFKRLQLYEGAYGFTTPRLYSYIFIIWLAVVFLMLLYKIFANRREHFLAMGVVLSMLAALVFVNILNVDGFVARKNIERYQATGKLDVSYFDQLSPDATKQAARLLDAANPTARQGIAAILFHRRQELLEASKSWQSANIARQSALETLNRRAPLLEEHKDVFIDDWYLNPNAR